MSDSLLTAVARKYGPEAFADAVPDELRAAMMSDWSLWARPEQLPPPGEWRTWVVLAGRGFGKSRTGAEWVRAQAVGHPGCHIALVAPTAADARDVMVRTLIEPWRNGEIAEVPAFEPSKRSVTWSNGSRATTYSADEPDRLRGPQHHFAWADELCAWRYPDAWDQVQFGLRLGDQACAIVTTTPRPVPLLRDILASPSTVITRGSTFDNAANLDPSSLVEMKRKYEGTRLGRQELYAEILDDVPGALWTRGMLDGGRVKACPVPLRRIVVAVDPSGGHDAENDEQGIVVAALGADGHAYVLEDCSCKLSPEGWGRRAVEAYLKHRADRILWERNFGGEMVEHVITTAARAKGVNVSTREVKASRGKVVRAEPVAALYEQGKVHHVGAFPQLEDQLCLFTPAGDFAKSPDRADALVWALTDLMLHDVAGYSSARFGERRT